MRAFRRDRYCRSTRPSTRTSHHLSLDAVPFSAPAARAPQHKATLAHTESSLRQTSSPSRPAVALGATEQRYSSPQSPKAKLHSAQSPQWPSRSSSAAARHHPSATPSTSLPRPVPARDVLPNQSLKMESAHTLPAPKDRTAPARPAPGTTEPPTYRSPPRRSTRLLPPSPGSSTPFRSSYPSPPSPRPRRRVPYRAQTCAPLPRP